MYPYELMEEYRKETYLQIIFDRKELKGFFRSWIDCKVEKALVIDQTYFQHVVFKFFLNF